MKKFLLVVGLLSISGAYGMEEGAMVPATEMPLYKQLVYAAARGDTNTISAFIKKGANVNVKYMRLTPLHMARTKEVVAILLENGANIEALDDFGATPLYRSIARDCEEASIALIDSGANVKALDLSGYTPLWVATLSHHEKVVNALLLAAQGKVKTKKEVKSSRDRIFTLLCICSIPKERKKQKWQNLPILSQWQNLPILSQWQNLPILSQWQNLPILPQLPKEIQKNILLYLPEDIISAKMFAQLLPIADKEQIRGIVKYVPRDWLVTNLTEKENEVKRNLVIEEAIDYAQKQATEYCSIKYDGKTLFEQTWGEHKQLLDPVDTDGKRAEFIRQEIEKEFAKKIAEDGMSSSSSSSGKQEENF